MRKEQTSYKNEHNTLMCFPLEPVFTRDKRRLPNFIDEPTSGLDPVSRDEILDIFISLSQDEGKTVFCSTHITSDLDRCADNIIYLKQGRIAENEPLCTLLQKYSVVQFSADNAPQNIELIGARREKDGISALVRNSELPAGVESAPAGLEDIMVHIEREGETK